MYIVFEDLQCAYIRITKCANTSIVHWLNSACKHPIPPKSEGIGLRQFEKQYPDFFKFTFVRNPWDRLVSCYEQKIRTKERFVYPKTIGKWCDENRFATPHEISFKEFVHFIYHNPDKIDWHWQSYANRARLPLDYIGRFETLEEDIQTVSYKLGISQEFPHYNKSRHRTDYRTYYDEETRRMAAEIYAEEIQMFGYQFDSEGRRSAPVGRSPRASERRKPVKKGPFAKSQGRRGLFDFLFFRKLLPKKTGKKGQKKLIYDVGMHIGQDTVFYLKKGFRVVAIEANPKLAEQAKKKFQTYLAQGQLTLVPKGIGETRGKFLFYINKTHSEWSSFDKTVGVTRGEYETKTISCVPLIEIIRQYGVPYYLKIDIEAHDFTALRSLEALPQKPAYVSVENGQIPMLDFLYGQGYKAFKFINQREVPSQRLPYPSREGIFISHQFPFGSSGAFGEETPGEWKDYATIKKEITDYWAIQDDHAREELGWFDLHARHVSVMRD
ncbi:MAG: FkbM family methyltransferase [Candidatus Omnitrophota bacterium]